MLNICFNVVDIWNTIDNFIKNVQSILTDLFDLFNSLVSFFPSPFKEILLGASAILLVVLIYNILRK